MKKCSTCKKLKQRTDFPKNKSNKDGYSHECKACKAIWVASHNGKVSRLLSSCRLRAKKSNSQMTLTKEWIGEKLKKGVCEITGIPFNYEARGKYTRQPHAPSVDRINTENKNYVPENCRLVLWAVNNALAEYGEAIMMPIFKKIIKNARQKKFTPIPTEHTGES